MAFGPGRMPSRKTYWADGKEFSAGKSSENRKAAEEYCLSRMLDIHSIMEFDSHDEFLRWRLLKEKEEKGEIRNLRVHFTFPLLPEFTDADGTVHRRMDYEADFVYEDGGGRTVVEDVKGWILPEAELKEKIFDWKYRDRYAIRMIKHTELTGWVPLRGYRSAKTRMKRLRDENRELKEKERRQESAERKEKRERDRLAELRAMAKPSAEQRRRLAELEGRYGERH